MQRQNRNSDLGACSQVAVFTYAVMRRTPRYEIRLAAFFADNLMNSVAHCGCDESQQPALGLRTADPRVL